MVIERGEIWWAKLGETAQPDAHRCPPRWVLGYLISYGRSKPGVRRAARPFRSILTGRDLSIPRHHIVLLRSGVDVVVALRRLEEHRPVTSLNLVINWLEELQTKTAGR